jgi:UDPglucose 6-dehydrogenase
MKIGIVGNGFVGSSVAYGFSAQTGCDATIKLYDKDESKSLDSLSDVVNDSDYIFVSVPTPSNKDGSINTDIVEDIFDEMNQINCRRNNIFLLRSTVTPGTTRRIQKKCKKLNIVFNPEFLTERSAKFDFINQARFIVGGRDINNDKVEKLFRWRFGESIPVIKTNYETAEMIKYMNNCYFATKVSFLNEMYQISTQAGVDWNMAMEGFIRDGRIGHSHLSVPGPDGKFGFGGSCFPKDIQAMIHFAENMGVQPDVLRGAWEKNLDVRPEEDWTKLKGRAIVDDSVESPIEKDRKRWAG